VLEKLCNVSEDEQQAFRNRQPRRKLIYTGRIRMIIRRWICALLALAFFTSVQGNTLTGVVEVMQVHPPSNGGYVRLVGLPTFDGGGCTSMWAVGDLNDNNFMIYIWPALLNAKNRGTSVSITVSGCVGPYPRVEWIQLN
jgi:hypothetical protein